MSGSGLIPRCPPRFMESYELEAQPDLCDRCGKKPATDVDGPCDWRDDDDGEFSLADLIGSDADPAEPGQ